MDVPNTSCGMFVSSESSPGSLVPTSMVNDDHTFSLLQAKDTVVLYVAHSNPAAARVYKHVGFVGFSSGSDGLADSWKELGFDRAKVNLGHW